MNPLIDNPLLTRDDFARSAVQLWEPLKSRFSPGGARVDLGRTGAHFTKAAAELEGFARPLFGLAPHAAGGFAFEHWALLRTGYANGCDPKHPEYWGNPVDRDQRLVESAAIGFGLLLARDKLWDPLSCEQRDNVARWLKRALEQRVADNNWHFFHVLVSLGLERVEVDHDRGVRERALQRLESFYVADGWYADGIGRRFDHYIGFAMHFYGLVYTRFAQDDEARCERMRQRATEFALEFQHWFDRDGASIPFGRSMTYRFAQASFWAGLAFADVEALPWGQVRGLWARNLRWWAGRDYFDRDGVMSVGYGYPNLIMSEPYNSPGSPYWAMKAYLPLALPDTHPFWAAAEQDKHEPDATYASRTAGMVGFGSGSSRVLLSSCSESVMDFRSSAEKYAKFAYSSSFGFSVDPSRLGFLTNPFDNMLALSTDCRSYAVRSSVGTCTVGADWLHSRWMPDVGVEVQTWLLARAPWHVRVHRLTTERSLYLTEGGFAVARDDRDPERLEAADGRALVTTADAVSIALDLSSQTRGASVRRALPNSSLHFPQTHVPHLSRRVAAGTHWLIGAYAADTDPARVEDLLAQRPDAPDIEWLEALVAQGEPAAGIERGEPDPTELFVGADPA